MKIFNACLVAGMVLGAGVLAHAKDSTGPCKPVYDACSSAGKKGKTLRSCVKSIKGGATVTGVSVTASDECKAAKGKK